MLVFTILRLLTLKMYVFSLMSLAHTYTSLEPETEHTMEFYNEARVDGLQKRVENDTKMTEYFVGRDDFLHVRHMEFGKRGKKIHLASTRTDINSRPIVVWPKQEQKNICHCDIYTMQNILPRALGSFSVGTAKANLQMGCPSLVQLLCLTVACLTESYSVTSCHKLHWAATMKLGNQDLENACQRKEKKAWLWFWNEIFTRLKTSQMV